MTEKKSFGKYPEFIEWNSSDYILTTFEDFFFGKSKALKIFQYSSESFIFYTSLKENVIKFDKISSYFLILLLKFRRILTIDKPLPKRRVLLQ